MYILYLHQTHPLNTSGRAGGFYRFGFFKFGKSTIEKIRERRTELIDILDMKLLVQPLRNLGVLDQIPLEDITLVCTDYVLLFSYPGQPYTIVYLYNDIHMV